MHCYSSIASISDAWKICEDRIGLVENYVIRLTGFFDH